tara:strand:+ start:2118 stop:2594 length:477 start_codon:yes stop_codon:yes gene_type:complete
MSNQRNRLAGIAYEADIVEKFNDIPGSPEVGRSATLQPELDANKVDIVTIEPLEFEEFALKVQAKTSTKHVAYGKLLKEIEENEGKIPLILHRKTRRVEKDRFLTEGTYAILNQEDFFNIISELKKYKSGFEDVIQYFDSISDEEQPLLHKRLLDLDL